MNLLGALRAATQAIEDLGRELDKAGGGAAGGGIRSSASVDRALADALRRGQMMEFLRELRKQV